MGFTHLFPLQLKCEKKNEGFENFMYEMAKNLLPVKKKFFYIILRISSLDNIRVYLVLHF